MRINIKGTIVPSNDKWIYDYFRLEAVCPKDVHTALEQASGEPLDVYINSQGGDVFSGSEIYAALREYQGEVRLHVVGLAASAASVIACAGPSDIAPTAQLMVHNVSCVSGGDYADHEHMSEVLRRANKSIAAAYVEKSGMTEEEALELMDRETWLPAEEAVKLGLIDKIAAPRSTPQLAADYGEGLLPARLIERMRNERTEKTARIQAVINELKGRKEND